MRYQALNEGDSQFAEITMNRRLLASVTTCFLIATVGGILAQGPPQPAGAGKGGAKGGQRPASVATPEDLADVAKLPNLPAWVKGAGDGDFSTGPDYTPAPSKKRNASAFRTGS